MAQAPERPALEPADDELTPELALVDPELAERARERLGDLPQRAVGAEHAVAAEPGVDAEPPVVEQIPTAETSADVVRREPFTWRPVTWRPAPEDQDERPPQRPRRRIGRALVVAVAVLGAIGIALVVPPLLLETTIPPPPKKPVPSRGRVSSTTLSRIVAR